ncbi:UBIQUITIN-CONJUGAT-2 domain-containing protein [Mycena venus]|uniref:UBIQUITIN-CONJUGAT-2 domain-containing protein n=1 Tax=Mycena venus TaxID=2733690 RepID=A0A8H7CRE0_9AGAR|nr:UBIQUITIN-CONJUGAT-2 domain-containing protein [Mycena venus]
MAGTSVKRPLSPSKAASGSPKNRKRARKDEDVITIEDDPDDLEAILALIKESEEKRNDDAAMARRLAAEWGTEPEPVLTSSKTAETVIDVDDIEDDAAMARRLAAEWGSELDPVQTSSTETVDVGTREPPIETSSKANASPSRTSSSSHEDNIPPDKSLAQFRPFFTAERNCTNCGKPVKSPRGFVMFSAATATGALPPSLAMLLHASCSSCRTNHCRGCFTPLECPVSCKGTSKNAKCTVASCCSGIRALAIFECLGGLDRQFLGERATSESRALALAQQMPKNASVGPGGTGYGTDSRGSSGYWSYEDEGGGRGRGRSRSRGRGGKNSAQSCRTAELLSHWDEIVVRALNTLTSILPSPYADSAQVYDMLPHPSIGYLLSLSQLPELLGGLLRNDSVTDWIARSDIYYAMIALLRRMADCELTVEVLIAQRFCMDKSSGLEDWMWEDGEITWEKDKRGRIERGLPLYDHFKKLTRQCEAFMAGAQQMMEDGDDGEEETIKAVSICGDIIAARDDTERAMSVLGRESGADVASVSPSKGKGKGKDRDPAVEMEKAYSQACETLSFKHIEIDYSQYYYHKDLKATESATRTPKGRLHLVKELAQLATSLPPGIWVRVDEIRNDAIKVMIAGPDDTPYSGGLFEFDCFMPLTYPATPPLMHLRTTGGGSVRFNPNLYNNGKVRHSNLDGISEEQWSSSSTLLQVLVSIQSMILIDAPYYNEPGHGKANPKAKVSINYNREISQQTCRWAITEWLKDSYKSGIWKDVIASHFTIRKDKIHQKILEWAASNPSIRSYRQYSKSNRESDLYGVMYGLSSSLILAVASTVMALTTTRSTLMHAALAHISPELREFDLIAFGKLRLRTVSRRRSLSSMPIELLLLIRAHLIPVLIAHFTAISSTSLQHYEASLRQLLCPQCSIFYEYAYGLDVWTWRLAGPCSCVPDASHVRRRPNPRQYRDRHHWLETYLSRKSLRFRGLSSSSSVAIWDVVSDILKEYGCEAIPSSRGGLLSRRDGQSTLVVPLRSAHCPSPTAKEDYSSAAPILFRRLGRDLGLSREYNEPCREYSATRSSTFEFPSSTRSPCNDFPVIQAILLQILDTVTSPLTAVLSILLSFLTLFFTVLCYHCRPGVLRLF